MTKTTLYHFGTGRRKGAVAQVRITKGTGKFVDIKKKEFVVPDEFIAEAALPLKLVSLDNSYDVSYIVMGGGPNSQKEAIQLGIARAASKIDEEISKTLKKANLLTRDPREKERKKPGLKRARRAPQWAKR